MKNLILGALLLVSSITMAQASSQDTSQSIIENIKSTVGATVKNIDTSSTFKTMYSDFKSAIGAMASSLKVGAEHVYVVLVKQQIVNSITYLVIFMLGLILVLNWFRKYKSNEQWINDYELPTGLGVMRTIQIILGCILILFGMVYINDIITGFVNPEYGALNEILSWVNKK